MDSDGKGGFKGLKKVYLVGFILLGVVLVVLSVLPFVLPKQGNNQVLMEGDDGTTETNELEAPAFTYFENSYQLEYSIGSKTAERMLSKIGRIIAESVAEKTKDGSQLNGEIIETSFKKDAVDSGYGFTFEVDVSSGEKYQVWVRTGGLYGYAYDAILVHRYAPERGVADLDIAVQRVDGESSNRGQLATDLGEWAKARLPDIKIVMNVADAEL